MGPYFSSKNEGTCVRFFSPSMLFSGDYLSLCKESYLKQKSFCSPYEKEGAVDFTHYIRYGTCWFCDYDILFPGSNLSF